MLNSFGHFSVREKDKKTKDQKEEINEGRLAKRKSRIKDKGNFTFILTKFEMQMVQLI